MDLLRTLQSASHSPKTHIFGSDVSVRDLTDYIQPGIVPAALTCIVHDIDVGPQLRAGKVVAVLNWVVESRQQDEQDHGVDELRVWGGNEDQYQCDITSTGQRD